MNVWAVVGEARLKWLLMLNKWATGTAADFYEKAIESSEGKRRRQRD